MLGGMPVSFTTKHSLHVYHVLLSLRKNKIYFQSIVCIHDYHVCFQAFVKIKYMRDACGKTFHHGSFVMQ